ncbi:hypothetical protein C2W64_01973 [Brevibacillus laterosporus]|nr:sigma-70 family RNA polymerase sigma factor [Brevibacillus laterosporus]RAP26429.1 hypothetical protein C2W64_01973 [Brevibacillus laterosporus]
MMSLINFLKYNSDLEKSVMLFIKLHPGLLSNPILKNFLKEEENLLLFSKVINSPTQENREELDRSFKSFYGKIRLLNFISKLLYYNAIDYDKKVRQRNQRYLLTLDKPIESTSRDDIVTIVDFIPSDQPTLDEVIIHKNNVLDEMIDDRQLSKAIKILTAKEKLMIELAYIHNMSDREIAKKLCVSHQAIGKTRKRAINKIRNYMEKKNVM